MINNQNLLTFDDLMKEGCIEFVDVEEEENAMIAMRLDDLKNNDYCNT